MIPCHHRGHPGDPDVLCTTARPQETATMPYDPGAPWRRWPITEHDFAAGSPPPRPSRMLLHTGHPFCAGGHAKVATAAAAAADRGSASS